MVDTEANYLLIPGNRLKTYWRMKKMTVWNWSHVQGRFLKLHIF